ncbi:MAG: hypothetical protein ABL929_02955 [Ferruginibacter sp.]|nr:hypothetical protein [Ferruginibacter sp.]
MDYEKKIRILLSENEFLQEQLEELNAEVQKKDNEISLLGEISESEGSLRSKIDCNLLEIEQLKYDNDEASKKHLALETLKDELEIELVSEIKSRQKEQVLLKELNSVHTNNEILNNELTEAALLYKKVQTLKMELSEAKSNAELAMLENEELKAERDELQNLMKELRIRNATK